jgi:RNA polymerase sigma-70 factor (family 1)
MAVIPLPNESELLAKIAGGDHLAFTTLFNHYQTFVFGFGKKLTHSNDLAIEIVQDVFLKIWDSREKLGEIESFIAYLNRLVRNHSFNLLRQMSQKAKSNMNLSLSHTEIEDSTVQQLDYNETLRIVNEAVDRLAPQQRLAYQLCHQQGLKYEEAAEQMSISPKTVHVHMKYALRKIREHLQKNSVVYPLVALALLK